MPSQAQMEEPAFKMEQGSGEDVLLDGTDSSHPKAPILSEVGVKVDGQGAGWGGVGGRYPPSPPVC